MQNNNCSEESKNDSLVDSYSTFKIIESVIVLNNGQLVTGNNFGKRKITFQVDFLPFL